MTKPPERTAADALRDLARAALDRIRLDYRDDDTVLWLLAEYVSILTEAPAPVRRGICAGRLATIAMNRLMDSEE